MSSPTTCTTACRCILLIVVVAISIATSKAGLIKVPVNKHSRDIKIIDENGREVSNNEGTKSGGSFGGDGDSDDGRVNFGSIAKQSNGQYESRDGQPGEQSGQGESSKQSGKGEPGFEGGEGRLRQQNVESESTGLKEGQLSQMGQQGQNGEIIYMNQDELDQLIEKGQPGQKRQVGQKGQPGQSIKPGQNKPSTGNGAKTGQEPEGRKDKLTGRQNADEEFDSLEKVPCDPDSGYPYADEINPMHYYICTKQGKEHIENRIKCNIGIFREDEASCIYSKPAPPVPIAEDCKYHNQVISSPNDCRCYYKCSQIPDTDEYMLEDLCRDKC